MKLGYNDDILNNVDRGDYKMVAEGKTKIVLLVQNARRLFCYFNCSPLSIKEFEDRYGEGTWGNSRSALKLCSIDSGVPKEIKTIEIDNFADNWYIDLCGDSQDVFLKLGKILNNGEFVVIAFSNIVKTPREYVSGDTTLNYIDVSKVDLESNTKLSYQEVAASNEIYNNRNIDKNNRENYFNQYYEGINEKYSNVDVSSPIR